MRDVGPFEAHIREAVELNRRRARHYASMTNGSSEQVFRRYILAERTILPAAAWFDWRSVPYHAAGVPLLSSIFESMDDVPPVSDAVEPRTDDGWSPHVGQITQELRSAFHNGGYPGLARASNEYLEVLTFRPWRDCMLRHQIESIRRVANVSPVNVQRAIELNLSSPERLLGKLVRFHLWGVRFAPYLDQAALPLQLQGVPILQNDLPQIAPWPRGWDHAG